MKKLRKVSLSGNRLTTLPKEVTELTNLEFLNISNNPFDNLPSEILGLKKLKVLRISNINFKSFPTEKIIKELINLKSIYCYSTHLQQIRTQDINRDYLFLAAYKGNSKQRIKSMLELSSQSESLQPSKVIAPLKGTLVIKSTAVGSITKTSSPGNLSLNRNLLFICYSHKDEKWRKKVETFIKSMGFEGYDVSVWSDKHLRTSDKWQDEIFAVLSKSKIAILLVSSDFLASDFIQNQELPKILTRAASDELRIMSIIISYCRFKENKGLSQYNSLNPPDSPLISMGRDKQDLYLYNLTKDIEHFLTL